MDARTALLAAIGICGFLILLLSFAPWIHFEGTEPGVDVRSISFSIPGTQIGRVVGSEGDGDIADQTDNRCTCRGDIGDGYITALLGILITVSAFGAMWRLPIRGATLVAALGSLAALAVATYNAVTAWEATAAIDPESDLFIVTGDATAWLWLLVGVSAASAILCGFVWSLSVSKESVSEDLPEEEHVAEGANGWA
jgi:hypothetical protein